jgi:hypothetical protein
MPLVVGLLWPVAAPSFLRTKPNLFYYYNCLAERGRDLTSSQVDQNFGEGKERWRFRLGVAWPYTYLPSSSPRVRRGCSMQGVREGVWRGPSYASPHPPLRDAPSTGLPSSRIHNKAPSSLAILHKVLSHCLLVLRLRTQPSAYILFSCLDVSCIGPRLLVSSILDFLFLS